MHHDFYRIDEYFTPKQRNLLNRLLPSEGVRWSDNIWISKKDDWFVFFRPLNLGLAYFQEDFFIKSDLIGVS